MKGDLPPAAYRLLTALPVRTVAAREVGGAGTGNRYQGKRPVRVDGVEYESKHHAIKGLGIGMKTLDRMLRTGEAEYVDATQYGRRAA